MVDEQWLTIEAITGMLGVHPQTVRRWIRGEGLPAVLLGRKGGYRVRERDLLAFLASRTPGRGKRAA